jgi:hypothetical protein
MEHNHKRGRNKQSNLKRTKRRDNMRERFIRSKIPLNPTHISP